MIIIRYGIEQPDAVFFLKLSVASERKRAVQGLRRRRGRELATRGRSSAGEMRNPVSGCVSEGDVSWSTRQGHQEMRAACEGHVRRRVLLFVALGDIEGCATLNEFG